MEANVISPRHCLEMIRIHTALVETGVVNNPSLWNLAVPLRILLTIEPLATIHLARTSGATHSDNAIPLRHQCDTASHTSLRHHALRCTTSRADVV